jgi:diguanylate cyclase (GGDEF)-like protein/PAS domain S-box-containing protein
VLVVMEAPGSHREPNALRRYELLSENTKDIVLFVRPDGQMLEANRAAVSSYGYSRQELLSMRVHDLRASDPPELVDSQMAEAREHGITFETVHRRKDGSTFPVEVSSSVSPIGGLLLSLVRDITQRKRVETTRDLLLMIDRQILERQPLPVILQTMCDRLAELFGYTLVWVALKQADGSVSVLAQAGVAQGFLQAVTVRWSETPEGLGPTGTAIRTGQPQLIPFGAPAWDWFREAGARYGLQCGLSLPLNAGGQTLGALSFYSTRADAFDADIMHDLSRFANQVAISLLAARDQEQIRLQTAALEAAANAVVITDRDGQILWVNRAFTDLTGYSAWEALHNTPRILKSGNQGDQFYKQMWETVLAGRIWRGELYNRRKDGTLYAEEMTITPVRDAAGEIAHFIAVKQDISERKRQEERLRHLAMHDPVTDLANRRSLAETLERAVNRSKLGRPGALLLLDLDNFKQVNDLLGHAAGDQLIVSVAHRLRSRLRPFDLLARWGGDEFAVLLEDAAAGEAEAIGARLVEAVGEARQDLGHYPHPLGVSIGVVPVTGDRDARSVMAMADRALYRAKEAGGNRVVLAAPDEALGTPPDAAAALRAALAEGRLTLWYQPVVRLRTGRVEQYEALLRLRETDGGLSLPGSFLPGVRRAGLMGEVDLWVLERVLEQLAANPALHISMNLSESSLSDAALVEQLARQVRDAGPAALRLAFEVSETAAVRDLAESQRAIWKLRGLGCRFALDD